MKTQDNANPRTLLGHRIAFVTSYEEAADLINRNSNYGEFFVIGDNVRKVPTPIQTLFQEKRVRSFRIRVSGAWNNLFRAMGDVDGIRDAGEGYAEHTDLMFISLVSAHEISSALNRHRAVNNITCREMYWLDTIDLGEEADDAIELALRLMPSVLTPLAYKDLDVDQRFKLTSFEFSRFTRPFHCVTSVENSYKAAPFYTDPNFGPTYQKCKPNVNVGTIGHVA